MFVNYSRFSSFFSNACFCLLLFRAFKQPTVHVEKASSALSYSKIRDISC